nr:hypothetical protein [Neobacillus sp. 179.-C4.2 HS]MDP5196706.1 hypothetical protein [Neobacillus sp. 179.-C4.2 HS]
MTTIIATIIPTVQTVIPGAATPAEAAEINKETSSITRMFLYYRN